MFKFKKRLPILLIAMLSILISCGKGSKPVIDYIVEDERSWNKQDTRIYKDPNNPSYTIIEDEFGKTTLGPNGEIISQTFDEEAPTAEVEVKDEVINDAELKEQVAEKIEMITPLINPVVTTDLKQEQEQDLEIFDENAEKPTPETWENYTSIYPYDVMKQTDECSDYPSLKDYVEFGDAIGKLGGSFANPTDYTKDLIGFTKFLTDIGVTYFSAYEMITPGNKAYANSCGLKVLLPNKGCWLRSGALALLADKIRGNQGRAIKLTSHLRTSCYNNKVGGSKKSDHLSSRAMDLSFGSKSFRKKAQDFICETFWKDDLVGLKGLSTVGEDQLNISIGLGQSFMHVGLGSRHGRRYWIYKSYKEGDNNYNSCWTKKL